MANKGKEQAGHHLYSRREAVKGIAAFFGGATLLPNIPSFLPGLLAYPQRLLDAQRAEATTMPDWSVATLQEPRIIETKTTELAKKGVELGGTEALAHRISKAWKAKDGFWYMAYQGAILQQAPDERVYLFNLGDELHNAGLDKKLNDGSWGVRVPPKVEFNDGSNGDFAIAWNKRIEHFKIPSHIVAFANKLREKVEIGPFCSEGENYGPFMVYRTQRMGIMEWTEGPNKGLVQRILLGDAAKTAGLVPKESWLPQPVEDKFEESAIEKFIGETDLLDSVGATLNGQKYDISIRRVKGDNSNFEYSVNFANEELKKKLAEEFAARELEEKGLRHLDLVVLPGNDSRVYLKNGRPTLDGLPEGINDFSAHGKYIGIGYFGIGRTEDRLVITFLPTKQYTEYLTSGKLVNGQPVEDVASEVLGARLGLGLLYGNFDTSNGKYMNEWDSVKNWVYKTFKVIQITSK